MVICHLNKCILLYKKFKEKIWSCFEKILKMSGGLHVKYPQILKEVFQNLKVSTQARSTGVSSIWKKVLRVIQALVVFIDGRTRTNGRFVEHSASEELGSDVNTRVKCEEMSVTRSCPRLKSRTQDENDQESRPPGLCSLHQQPVDVEGVTINCSHLFSFEKKGTAAWCRIHLPLKCACRPSAEAQRMSS